MKFHKITIEGITSIKAKASIDFTKDLYNEDLFAITGQTGSGKSSILNSIGLALYNTGNKKINPEEYISLGAYKGTISLDFSINNILYSSFWECRLKSRSGKPIKPVVSKILRREGQVINQSPEDVIGLDSKQFFKTIIINQGKFNEFLSAPFKDRKVLLEQICGTDNISGLSRFIKRKIKEIHHELSLNESKKEGSLPFSEEEYQEKTLSLSVLKKQHNKLKNDLLPLQQLLKQISEINNYLTAIDKDEKILQKLSKELDTSMKNYKEALEVYNNIDNEYKEILKSSQIDLPMLKHAEKSLLNKKNIENINISIASDLEHKNDALMIANKSILDKNAILSTLEKQYSQFPKNHLSKLSKEDISKIQSNITDFTSIKSKIRHQTETINKRQIKLKEIETLLKKQSEDISIVLNDQRITVISDFEIEILNLQSEKDIYDSKIKDLEISHIQATNELEKIIHTELDINKILPLIDENQKNINEKMLKKQIVEKDFALVLSLQKQDDIMHAIDICKTKALEDKKCPICSSDINTQVITLDSNKKDNNQLLTKISDIEGRLKLINKEIDNLEIINQEKLSEATLKKNKFEVLFTDFKKFKKLEKNIHTTGCLDILSASYSKQTKEALLKVEYLDLKIKMLQKTYTELLKKEISLKTTKNEYLTLKNEIEIETKTLQYSNENLSKLTQNIKDISKKQNIDEQYSHYFEQERQSLIVKNDCYYKIENVKLESSHLLIQKNNYSKEIDSLELKRAKNIEQIKTLKSSIDNNLKLTKFESVEEGLKFYDITIAKLLRSVDKSKTLYFEISRKKDILSNNINIKTENIKSQRLENTKLQSLIVQFDYANHTNSHIKKFGQKILERKFKEFNFEDHSYLQSFYETILLPIKELAEEDILTQRDQIVQLNTEIKQFMDKTNLISKLSDLSDRLNKKLSRQKNLLEALGKDDFGRYAAALIEQQLIHLCNKEMESLCESRYEIVQLEKNKTNGPEFFIVDRWREAQLRNISTLSGGETFLVSLAMALGLAEMTRGKVEIESFFIDEGFGTLDDDSIDEVLNILLTIRSRGKQIGIISHVTSLTDRIPVRICLEKDQWGESSLSISQSI